MREFSYATTAQQVVFGAGSLARLPELVAAHGWRRLLLCAPGHARRDGTVDRLAALLGPALAAVLDGVRPHVPGDQVDAAVELAEGHAVDAVVAVGGGSPIGMAKAVGFARGVSVVAIPTTYAGSEMTPVYGVTRARPDGTTRKVTVRDPRIVPRVVLYDPEPTLRLPPDLTASTGVNALAHCVEAAYSRTRHPLSTAAALEGARLIARALPRCHARGDDLAARAEMLEGAHLGGVALASVDMGLHHGTGHVLGGSAGVPHGVANCIVLPHAVRFNADAVAPQLARVAEALGVPRDGRDDLATAHAAADFLDDFVRALGQPRRLRDVGVPRAQLPALADALLASAAVAANPKPLGGPDAARAYLEAMW